MTFLSLCQRYLIELDIYHIDSHGTVFTHESHNFRRHHCLVLLMANANTLCGLTEVCIQSKHGLIFTLPYIILTFSHAPSREGVVGENRVFFTTCLSTKQTPHFSNPIAPPLASFHSFLSKTCTCISEDRPTRRASTRARSEMANL